MEEEKNGGKDYWLVDRKWPRCPEGRFRYEFQIVKIREGRIVARYCAVLLPCETTDRRPVWIRKTGEPTLPYLTLHIGDIRRRHLFLTWANARFLLEI